MPKAIGQVPQFQVHRTVTADDGAAPTITDINLGSRADGYEKCVVNAVPSGTANPVMEVLFWSDAAGRFIPTNPATSLPAAGADVAQSLVFDVIGRIFIVIVVSGTGAGSTIIEIAGFGNNRLG